MHSNPRDGQLLTCQCKKCETVAILAQVSWLRVVEILDIKPLRSAVPCNGCMRRKGLQICSTAKPSLGNTSFKGVLTLLSLP